MYDRDLWDAMLDMTDRLGTNMATENQKIETDNGTLRKICYRRALIESVNLVSQGTHKH